MKLTRIPHLDGDAGVAQTIRQMIRLIDQGKKDPQIRELIARILARVPGDNTPSGRLAAARAIFDFASRNIRFTLDTYGNETLHAAREIVRLGFGDCDDFTVLILSLAQAIGFPGRIVTIATDLDGEFSHVYPEVEVDGRWIALDAARSSPAFGRSPERFTRKRVWDLDGGYADMRRLGDGRQSIGPNEGPIGAWRAQVFPPFRGAARRMTGTYLRAFPIAPPHQRFIRPPIGLGNYGAPAAARALGDFGCGERLRALGQWGNCAAGDTACEIATVIQAGTQGTANIISAQRASPFNLFPSTSPSTSAPRTAVPVNYAPTPSLLPYSEPGTIFGIPTGIALLAGLGIIVAMSHH